LFILESPSFVDAQISPAEITNPRLNVPEQTYFRQLIALNRAIAQMNFPFSLSPRRYIGLRPKNEAADTRGLEFVLFHDRLLLKISGDYNAAFDGALLTQNERARNVFNSVAVPILSLLPRYFSASASFDGFGLEFAYHVRTQTHAYQYEGVEILTMVLGKDGALAYAGVKDEARRQEILDESEIYLDNSRFGLSLQGREPYSAEVLESGSNRPPLSSSEGTIAPSKAAVSSPAGEPRGISAEASTGGAGSVLPTPPLIQPALHHDAQASSEILPSTVAAGERQKPMDGARGETMPGQTDLDSLQNEYQQQLETLAKEGAEQYHFVSYAPPSFVAFHNRVYLQLTLRNPSPFDRNTTSIYKRSAQDFDLFLAPMLKSLVDRLPTNERIAGLDITILNRFGVQDESTSEAVELLCPLPLLRQYADAEVTGQDVINGAIVLVNGMRIGLDLQKVE
jgi:hypothetical protein